MATLEEKICVVCKSSFKTAQYNKKYCSKKCKGIAERIRKGNGNPLHWNHGKKNFSEIPKPCKNCGVIIEDRKSNNKQYCDNCGKDRYKTYERNALLKRLYNIDESVYKKLLVEQNGVCKICGKKNNHRKLAIDHCHKNGHVRGLLCDNCNRGLGNFNDDIVLLQNAIKYIQGDK